MWAVKNRKKVDKLGLNWAKLSSNWNWTLIYFICNKLMNYIYYWLD